MIERALREERCRTRLRSPTSLSGPCEWCEGQKNRVSTCVERGSWEKQYRECIVRKAMER